MSSLDDFKQELARRCLDVLSKLPNEKKRKLNVLEPAKKQDVARLPQNECIDVLREHAIIKMFDLSVESVYQALQKVLSLETDRIARDEARFGTPTCTPIQRRCTHCDGHIEQQADCWSCTSCGTVESNVNIFCGNPYREFSETKTRRHHEEMYATKDKFSSEETIHNGVANIGGHMNFSNVTMIEATSLLKRHPHLANEMVAAAAALIAVTMHYNRETGVLTKPASPPGFRCNGCGQKMDSLKSARYHCRNHFATVLVRPESFGYPLRRP